LPFHVNAEYAPPRSWDQFEELCADVFQSTFGDPTLVRYGRAGQAQQGIDILARSGGLYPIGLQCKKKAQWPVRKITKADVDAAVKEALKFKPALKAFYILTTAPDDAPLLAYVATLNQRHDADGLFQIVLLGWGEIVRRATLDPAIADKHFGPTGGISPRSPLLATWMMSKGVLETKAQELELSVAELAQDLRDMPAGHFVIRQRESDDVVEKLKDFAPTGLSAAQRRRRIELREELRKLTEREARAIEGVRLMLSDPDISSWLLKVWEPQRDVHLSVAAYIENHTGGGQNSTGIPTYLRLYPPQDHLHARRHAVRLTKQDAASVMRNEQDYFEKYKKPITQIVSELPDAVRARAAIPRIVQGILEFKTVDRLPADQIRALGAFDIGSWTYELA
jgi:hypothetical protein